MNDRTGVAALVVAAVGFWAVGVLVDVTAGLVVLVAGVACGVALLVRAHDDERRRRLCRRAGAGLLLLPLAPGTLAAETPGGVLAPHLGLGAWTVVSFGAAFALLLRYAWPQLLAAVEARERHLRELAAAAEEERARAVAVRREAERELEEARARIRRDFREAREATERMREAILAEAREQRAEILARAHREAEQIAAAARDPEPRVA